MRVAVNEFAKSDYAQRNRAAESKHVDVTGWHIALALRLIYVGQVINARAKPAGPNRRGARVVILWAQSGSAGNSNSGRRRHSLDHGTTKIGACQNATFCPIGFSTLT